MSGGIGGATLAAGGAGGTIDPTTGAPNPGSTPSKSQTNAAGGGGGSAGGGAGGAGAMTIGGGGSMFGGAMSFTGGTGGTGGSNAVGPVQLSTGSNAVNGNGGNGTQGTTGTDQVGGGGGEGGYGLILIDTNNTTNTAFSNTGTLSGGNGGNAIDGAVGGDGGIAIDVLASSVTLTTSKALTGGNAGSGSQTTYTNGVANVPVYGKGGAAIAGANLTIIDSSGNLTGGLNGDGSQGAAIDFTGGANTLKITGGTVTGGIIDTGSLTLESASQSIATYSGISGTGSVDVASNNSVYLLGANTYAGGTTIDGDLELGNGTTAGTLVGPVTIDAGGALDLDLPASSSPTLGAVSGVGTLFTEPGSSVTIVSDDLAAGGMFSSTYNYGTLTIEGGTTSGNIQNGGTLNLAQTGATPLTISGVISDLQGEDGTVVGTVNATSGTTILSGANTYTGNTYLQGGVIDAENAAAFGTGIVYAFDPEIDYGPALGSTATSATQTNGIVLDSAGDPTTLKVAGMFTETISGDITTGTDMNAAAAQKLVVDGAGTLVLSGANSFTGGTTLGGSGTLELDSASAAGASAGAGTNGAVTFATGSTATLRIDQAALSSQSYADPISNFAYGEAIDLRGLTYVQGQTRATLSGGELVIAGNPIAGQFEYLTDFADAPGQSGQFATASDGNGGTLVTLLPPPPAAPTNLAVKGTPTLDGTVEVTGTATGAGDANGDAIALYADGGTAAVGTGTVTNGAFDIPTTATFADGSHTFTATDTSKTTGLTSANSGGSTLYVFSDGADGGDPSGSLFADAAGNLIGTTTGGGSNNGTVFEIANTGTPGAPVYAAASITLYTFTGENTDGAEPDSGLVADAHGDLFGTTRSSGSVNGQNVTQNNGAGAVFEVANTGTATAPAYADGAVTLATVGGDDGNAGPEPGLAIDAAGDLFGTTFNGGTNGQGAVFEIAKIGNGYATAPTTLYSFTGQGTDGSYPAVGLITDAAGDLFGTAKYGGANNGGTVFEIANTNGAYATAPTTLYSFTGSTDGANPGAGLIADAAGNLYGTTSNGGANDGGTVFEIAKNGSGTFAAPTTLASLAVDANPTASLAIDAAGNLYGTSYEGGADGDGTVFEIAKINGTYATTSITLQSFTGSSPDGTNPAAGLLALAGDLYGTTEGGGADGAGAVFETIPTGIAPVVIAAVAPTLTQVSGTANNGGDLTVQGTTADAVGDKITLYDGTATLGSGTVQPGGSGGANIVSATAYDLPDGSYSFTAIDTSADGTTTSSASNTLTATVAATAPTNLHQVGTTANGGTVTIAGSSGDAAGDTITLYKGTAATAANEVGTGTVNSDGTFTATAALPDGSYVITATDTSVDGTVTSPLSNPLTSTTLTTLHSFTGQGDDGAEPQAGLIADAGGDLFGTTVNGGANRYGTVFEIANTGTASNPAYSTTPTTLVSFNFTDGDGPQAALIADAKGDLFGTTAYGGANGGGTVFEIANTGTAAAPAYATTPTTLVSFNENDGATPEAGLLVDGAGNLIGTTSQSGDMEPGEVFEIANTSGSAANPTYAAAVIPLHTFTGQGTDGADPQAGLVADAKGDLFGTTTGGGTDNDGTVFEISNNGTVGVPAYAATATTLYSFTGQGTDGAEPQAGLVTDAAGDLYGTTTYGGANNEGVVFEIADTGGTYASAPTTLYSFTGQAGDGARAAAALAADPAGDLYGTTTGGGTDGDGAIFEIVKDPDGSFAAPVVLHSFGGTDGDQPEASLLLAANGTLLGTTADGGAGGADGNGTVFALTSQASQPTAIVTATPPTGLAQKGTPTPGNPIEITGTGDAQGDTITLYNGSTVVGMQTAGAGGAFDMTTTTDFAAGQYTLTATNTSADGTEVSAPATVSLTVAAGTPTATAQSDAVGFNTAAAITLTGSDPDSPALPLTYAVASGPAHGTLSGSGSSETYTPAAGYQGADSFTFTDSNGSNTSAPATVSLTVAAGTPTATAQSDAVGFNTAAAITLTGSDPDSPALPLTYAVASGPAHGTLSGSGSSETYTPAAGYQGADSFTFTDSNGSNTSVPATVSLTVAAGTPTATAQSDAVGFNTAAAITLTGSDPDSPALPLTYATASGPAHGTLSGSGANETYTPNANYQGADSFTFTDSNGQKTSSVATVSLTVAPPPVTITAPALGSSVSIIDPAISGTAGASAAGSTITLTSGQNVLGSTAVAGDGSWSDKVLLPSDGLYTIVATDTANGQSLGSASDTFTLNSTTNETLFGSTTTDVTSAGGQVYALYETILGRAPDPTGFEGWVAALQSGTPLSTIAQDFLGSPEYAADYGSSVQSDSAFVSQLYEDGLHRAPDAPGLQTWDDALANGSLTRAQVAVDIATSQESQNDLSATFQQGVFVPNASDSSVARLYYGLLGRAPDAAGLQGWEGEVASGTTIPQVAQDFLAAPEYAAGAVGQSNLTYVEGLYQSALGRTGATSEAQGWQAALDNGSLTRAGVADDFLTSPEFVQDEVGQSNTSFVAALYQAALSRAVDPSGQQTWVGALDSGALTRNAVAQDIVGSAEFAANVTAPAQATFVNAIYEGVFGRPASVGELQGWQGALSAGTTVAGVAVGIAESAQAAVQLVPKIESGFHVV